MIMLPPGANLNLLLVMVIIQWQTNMSQLNRVELKQTLWVAK